jgi:cell division cycle protein 37
MEFEYSSRGDISQLTVPEKIISLMRIALIVRMTAGKAPATAVFSKDVEDTYAHLVTRVAASLEEESLAGQEQIQLVPENPEQTISFNVPDGPPPANLVLEGPGTEELDVEEVRKTLQLRWDMFNAFPEDLKKALQSGTLEAVNRVLGNMRVEDAEKVVDDLNNAGILNFAEGGIRDETGKSTAEVEGAEQDEGN